MKNRLSAVSLGWALACSLVISAHSATMTENPLLPTPTAILATARTAAKASPGAISVADFHDDSDIHIVDSRRTVGYIFDEAADAEKGADDVVNELKVAGYHVVSRSIVKTRDGRIVDGYFYIVTYVLPAR